MPHRLRCALSAVNASHLYVFHCINANEQPREDARRQHSKAVRESYKAE